MKAVTLTLLVVCSIASANIMGQKNKIIAPNHLLSEAKRLGLSPGSIEKAETKDIRSWPDERVRRRLFLDENNPSILQATEDEKLLEKARAIANVTLFKAVNEYWNVIKTTSLNTNADANFRGEYEFHLRRDLNNLSYVKSLDKQNLLFTLPWAEVKVDRKLNKVSWLIRTGNIAADVNKLQEGVDEIVVPSRRAE